MTKKDSRKSWEMHLQTLLSRSPTSCKVTIASKLDPLSKLQQETTLRKLSLDSPKSTSKYRNNKTEAEGIIFDSKKEANRYLELRRLEKFHHISDLKIQVRFEIVINSMKVCAYVADFTYIEDGKLVVEDVKGFKDKIYRLKKKLMKACHGIDIREI